MRALLLGRRTNGLAQLRVGPGEQFRKGRGDVSDLVEPLVLHPTLNGASGLRQGHSPHVRGASFDSVCHAGRLGPLALGHRLHKRGHRLAGIVEEAPDNPLHDRRVQALDVQVACQLPQRIDAERRGLVDALQEGRAALTGV